MQRVQVPPQGILHVLVSRKVQGVRRRQLPGADGCHDLQHEPTLRRRVRRQKKGHQPRQSPWLQTPDQRRAQVRIVPQQMHAHGTAEQTKDVLEAKKRTAVTPELPARMRPPVERQVRPR